MSKEAMKLALEALNDAWGYGTQRLDDKLTKAIKALEEALAKQEHDEPVAVVDADDGGYWADILPDRSVKVGQLLYTTPQQRTWVGLTLTDKEEYLALDFGGNRLDAMDWAARRLKEKNT